jgi:hypothetical protein
MRVSRTFSGRYLRKRPRIPRGRRLWPLAHRQRTGADSHLNGGGSASAPCTSLVGMEHRRVGHVGSHTRVQDPIQEHLTPDHGSSGVPKELLGRTQTQRLADSHTGLCCKRRTRSLAGTARPGILLSGLSRSQTVRRVAHGHRPALPEPIHFGGLIQDGVGRLHPASASSGRVGGVNRFGGRLPPHTYAPPIMEVPKVRPRGRGLRISSPSFRPGSRTVRVHSGDENGVNTLPRIPRRLSLPVSVARELSKTGRVNHVSYALSGFPDQRKEIGIDSLPGIHVSGSVVQSGTRHGQTCPSQIVDFPSVDNQADGTNRCISAGPPQATRPYGVLCSTPSGSESCQKGAADAVGREMGLQPMGFPNPTHDVVQSLGRDLATGRIPRTVESAPPPLSNANAIHRRLQHRLGRSSQYPSGVGDLVCISEVDTSTTSRWRLSFRR